MIIKADFKKNTKKQSKNLEDVFTEAREFISKLDESDGGMGVSGIESDIRTVMIAIDAGLSILLDHTQIIDEKSLSGITTIAEGLVMLDQIHDLTTTTNQSFLDHLIKYKQQLA